jgi:nitrite reductase (NADH) small subunit
MIAEHKTFYNVGSIERIPLGEGRTYRVEEADIAVFRTRSGGVYATQAACSHKGGPLADGFVGPSTVICPLHSFKFNLATGQPIENPCQGLKVYTVQVNENGDVLLALD